MHLNRFTGLACAALFAIACTTEPDNTMTEGARPSGEAAQRAAEARPAQAATQDAFLHDMAEINVAEVELGELAARQATNPAVKQFGQRMVDDHKTANEQLKQVASSLRVDLPSQPDDAHETLAERLDNLEGAAFDREYIAAMVKGHEEAAAKLKKHVSAPELAPAVKEWASDTLAHVQKHLAEAKAIQGKLGSATAPASNN